MPPLHLYVLVYCATEYYHINDTQNEMVVYLVYFCAYFVCSTTKNAGT